MNAAKLMTDLARLGIRIEAHGDRLRYSPRSAVTPELLARLKVHKADLLAMLRRLSDSPDTQTRDAVSPALNEQARSLLNDIRAVPTAGAMHVFRSRSSNPASGGDWPADVAALGDFVLLLTLDDLPAVPFDDGPAAIVVDAAKYLRWLQADVRRGPNGPRARYGAIQNDLRRLRAAMR